MQYLFLLSSSSCKKWNNTSHSFCVTCSYICDITCWVLMKYQYIVARFEVRTRVAVKITAFWEVTPCSLVDRNEHFVGTFCFHHYCRTGKRTSFGFIHHVVVVCSDVSEERTLHLSGVWIFYIGCWSDMSVHQSQRQMSVSAGRTVPSQWVLRFVVTALLTATPMKTVRTVTELTLSYLTDAFYCSVTLQHPLEQLTLKTEALPGSFISP